MYRIKIKGNFLIIIDDDTLLENVRHPLSDCTYSIFNQLGADPLYRLEGLTKPFKFEYIPKNDYLFSEIVDENGDDFTDTDTFETLLDDSLGKHSASISDAILEYRKMLGHGDYQDSVATNETFTGTLKKLEIDGLGAFTETRGLPNSGDLWDILDNKVTGVNLMDKGDLRIALTVVSVTSNPTRMDIVLDVGGDTSVTLPIAYDSFTFKAGYPQKVQFSMPWYSGNNFIANGGQLFVSVNSGTATVSNRNIFISKDIAGLTD